MSDSVTEKSLKTIIIPNGEGEVLNAFGDTVQVKLSGEQTGGTFALGLGSTPPGGGPPPHRHHNEDELFIVIEGKLKFLANGNWVEGKPGDVVYTPRGVVHTFQNIGDTVAKFMVFAAPSGFEKFFDKCAQEFAKSGPPDMGKILAISAEHGIEFVPPLGA